MSYTLKTAVHVDLRADGEDLSGTYGPGVADLPAPVAALLVAQGHAVPAEAKTSKISKTNDTNPSSSEG